MAPGTPVFELADTGVLEVVFGVPDTVVGRLAAGQPLPLFAQVLAGASFLGKVATVSPSADPQSRVFRVEVAIPNPDDRLKIGMIVSVEVPSDPPAARPAAAGGAALRRGARPAGRGLRGLRGRGRRRRGLVARERSVAVGEIFGSEVSLESGVELGQQVIVAGATLLADGDPVVVIP